jgi:hypothetical protein
MTNRSGTWMETKRVQRFDLGRAWDVSTTMLRGRVDDAALLATWVSIVALGLWVVIDGMRTPRVAHAEGWAPRNRTWLLVAATWAVVRLSPSYVAGTAVSPRMMVFAHVFTLLALGRGLAGPRMVALVPALGSAFVTGWLFLAATAWFQRGPARNLASVLAHLPEGQVVAPLISGRDPQNPFSRGPYQHLPHYATVLRGAVVAGSFAKLPVTPVRPTRSGHLLRAPWTVKNFDAEKAARRFGWVLVREPFAPAAERAFRARTKLRLAAHAGAFWLYEIPGGFRPAPRKPP